jgi:adenosylcobinamide-phosphate synthase
MKLEYQVLCAAGIDLLCGDPRWLPHPVKLIGRGAMALEAPLRRRIPNPRAAGIVAVLMVVGTTAASAWALLEAATIVGAWAETTLSIALLYTTLAARDLADHALAVARPLAAGNLDAARTMVGRMVGRDTDCLDERGIARATVESVAENTVDGVTAPLFFAMLGGPVLALAYKAASTLDSTFGYKNERYLQFGWASARLDDVLAWVPARLTLPVMTLAAACLGQRAGAAWRYGWRDSSKHPSPNSGFGEATAAGALGVQLGGPVRRRGVVLQAPLLGEPVERLHPRHIRRAVALMLATGVLMAGLLAALRQGLTG